MSSFLYRMIKKTTALCLVGGLMAGCMTGCAATEVNTELEIEKIMWKLHLPKTE